MDNLKTANYDIEKSRISSHRWLVVSCTFFFFIWSFVDFFQSEPLFPLFLIIRFAVFASMILLASPLNKYLFQKYHYQICSILLTIITSSSVFFTITSEGSASTNSFFITMVFISTAVLFQAKHKFFLPIILTPFLILIPSQALIQNPAIIYEMALLHLLFLCIVTFIAHMNIYHFSEKSYDLRLKFEDKRAETDNLLEENKQLLRILCHDLGNALTIIDMSIINIERVVTPNEEQASLFKKNIDRLKRAATTQKEIMGYVAQKEALESGKQEIDFAPVNLNIIFEKVKFIFLDQLESRKITLSVNYSIEKNPYVMAELVSLSNNVINNIVSNSIKFSPDNSEIIISTWRDKNSVFITIEDFGIGMSEELMKDVFSTTIKTSRPGVRGEKGTGFGMPLAKSYMIKYGGDLIVESKEGKGTRFTLKFHSIDDMDNNLDIDSNIKLAS